MHFTLWPSRTANEGGHTEIEWSTFLGFVAEPQIAEDKNALEGWSPAKFTGNRRAKSAVELVSCIVLDDDASGLSLERLEELWCRIGGVIHTSHSHTDTTPKYRVVLRVSRDMSTDEHARVWAFVHAYAAERGQTLDKATRDPSRLWYLPAHRAGAPYEWRELPGASLDVDAILASVPAEPPAPPRAEAGLVPTDRRHAMATALGASWPATGRHAAQLALAGALRGEGYTAEDAVEFLCTVCRIAGDEDRPKREATVRHTWGKPEGSALTGWTRLKAHVDPVIVEAARAALGRDAGWLESTNRRLAAAVASAPATSPSGPRLPVGDSVQIGPIAFEVGGYDADLPPINYQIDGLIARGEVVMFVAHGNSLKTWLAFSMAAAIASGRPWLGRYVTTRGRAALLDFESGRHEVLRRLKILGVKSADVEDRLLRASYPGAQLVDPDTWVGLAGHGLESLTIDSFSAASPGDDENDSRAALMLQHAGRFAEHTSCTVSFIHHTRKGSGGDRRESVRGSTAIFAACDRIFEFDEPEKKPGGVVLTTMRAIKDGAGRSPSPVRVELSDQGLRFVEMEPDADETKDESKACEQRIIEILKKHPQGANRETLIEALPGRKASLRGLVKAVLATMILNGLVIEQTFEKRKVVRLNHKIEL